MLYESLDLLYPKFSSLIRRCWSEKPKDRPSAGECGDALAKIILAKEEKGLDSVRCAADLISLKKVEEWEQTYIKWSSKNILGVDIYLQGHGLHGKTMDDQHFHPNYIQCGAIKPIVYFCTPKFVFSYIQLSYISSFNSQSNI